MKIIEIVDFLIDFIPNYVLSPRIFTTLAGTPVATAPSGTSFVTTEPAPMTAPFPIRTPANIIAPTPSHASSSTIILPFVSKGCLEIG